MCRSAAQNSRCRRRYDQVCVFNSEEKLFGRQTGKGSDGGDCVIEIKHFENRIVGTAVFFAETFVVIEHFLLDGNVVLEDDISAQSDPCFFGGGGRQFDRRMVYQFLVDIFSVAGAKPEPVVGFEAVRISAVLIYSMIVHKDMYDRLKETYGEEEDER